MTKKQVGIPRTRTKRNVEPHEPIFLFALKECKFPTVGKSRNHVNVIPGKLCLKRDRIPTLPTSEGHYSKRERLNRTQIRSKELLSIKRIQELDTRRSKPCLARLSSNGWNLCIIEILCQDLRLLTHFGRDLRRIEFNTPACLDNPSPI